MNEFAYSVRLIYNYLPFSLTFLFSLISSTGVVYVLVHRWLAMQTHHSNNNNNNNNTSNNNSTRHSSHTNQIAVLTMDAVRLQHLRILLAAGGGSRDEEAEQMVHQVGCFCLLMCIMSLG